jgi:hypothetical protein
MTFEEALAQIEAAVREHGAARRLRTLLRVSEAVPSRKSGSLEMVSLSKAFERIVGELTLEAKSSALAAMASFEGARVPDKELSAISAVRSRLRR